MGDFTFESYSTRWPMDCVLWSLIVILVWGGFYDLTRRTKVKGSLYLNVTNYGVDTQLSGLEMMTIHVFKSWLFFLSNEAIMIVKSANYIMVHTYPYSYL